MILFLHLVDLLNNIIAKYNHNQIISSIIVFFFIYTIFFNFILSFSLPLISSSSIIFFVHSSTHSFIHQPIIHPFIHSSIHSFIHPSTHSSTHPSPEYRGLPLLTLPGMAYGAALAVRTAHLGGTLGGDL